MTPYSSTEKALRCARDQKRKSGSGSSVNGRSENPKYSIYRSVLVIVSLLPHGECLYAAPGSESPDNLRKATSCPGCGISAIHMGTISRIANPDPIPALQDSLRAGNSVEDFRRPLRQRLSKPILPGMTTPDAKMAKMWPKSAQITFQIRDFGSQYCKKNCTLDVKFW